MHMGTKPNQQDSKAHNLPSFDNITISIYEH